VKNRTQVYKQVSVVFVFRIQELTNQS